MTKQSFLQMKTIFGLQFPTDIYDDLHMVKLNFFLLERCKLIMSKIWSSTYMYTLLSLNFPMLPAVRAK